MNHGADFLDCERHGAVACAEDGSALCWEGDYRSRVAGVLLLGGRLFTAGDFDAEGCGCGEADAAFAGISLCSYADLIICKERKRYGAGVWGSTYHSRSV